MSEREEELEREVISDLIDITFDGRGRNTNNIGEPDSVSMENLSRKVLVRALLEEEVTKIEEKIQNTVLEENFEQYKLLEHLISLARTWKAMKLLTTDNKERSLPEVFLVDVLFLEKCCRSLFPGRDEEEILLTGVKTGRLNVFTKIVEVETESSANKVKDIPRSSYRELRKLDNSGMPLLGVFHSHPNVKVPNPSSTDLAQFGTYENHGLRALGGIITKQGFLRFFTKNLEFEILITGSGATKKEENLYYLENKEI